MAAAKQVRTIRVAGELADLVVIRPGEFTMTGFRVPAGVDVVEPADGRVSFGGDTSPLGDIPEGSRVRAIVYRSADDRFGVGTKGKEVSHVFQGIVHFTKGSGVYWLTDCTIGPQGIEG